MTQPDYVPIAAADRVRPAERMPVPDNWRPDRPADMTGTQRQSGPRFGNPGPDQGYALKLARLLAPRLTAAPGEHLEDATAGCLAVGLKRASLFGRAPVIFDLELAFTVWGYLGSPPADLVAFRVPIFQGADHHYETQRAIADRVSEATLRLSPAEVTARLADWRTLITAD